MAVWRQISLIQSQSGLRSHLSSIRMKTAGGTSIYEKIIWRLCKFPDSHCIFSNVFETHSGFGCVEFTDKRRNFCHQKFSCMWSACTLCLHSVLALVQNLSRFFRLWMNAGDKQSPWKTKCSVYMTKTKNACIYARIHKQLPTDQNIILAWISGDCWKEKTMSVAPRCWVSRWARDFLDCIYLQ